MRVSINGATPSELFLWFMSNPNLKWMMPGGSRQYDAMWLKQCHERPLTGTGKHSTYENVDASGMLYFIVLTILYRFI